MQADDEEAAVSTAARKKGVGPDYLLAILRNYRNQIEKGKKLQFAQTLEAIVDEEVGRRTGK